MNTWIVVVAAVVVVLTGILVLRQHAFLTLLLASLLVATMTSGDELGGFVQQQVDLGKMTQADAIALMHQSAPQRLATAFGQMAGKVGILIALASVIGACLAQSGAAGVIAQQLLSWTGPNRAPSALAASSFMLGIPVFFDTVFYLMIPLARSLRQQTGRDFVLYICAIIAGGSIAHSLVPPTPGPLLVAGIFNIDIATMMLAGGAVGAATSVLSLLVARVINRYVDVPLRAVDGSPLDGFVGDRCGGDGDDRAVPQEMATSASGSVPSLMESLLPILAPIGLIAGGSLIAMFTLSGRLVSQNGIELVRWLGDKNIALAVGTMLALFLLRHCPRPNRKSMISQSLSDAGGIILITCAGGAFGAMLRQAGIGPAVGELVETIPASMLLPVAFLVTAAIRTLQGSATVAMITAAGILQGIAESQSLPFHPVYLALAIGVGSKPISWMNDSGFWVITRMSGMTESEGLKVVSPMLTAMGICGLGVTMVLATLVPAI